MSDNRKKLYLVDGSSYIFRAYYAIRSLSSSKGLPTNALYGFTRMLLKLIKEEKPDKLAVVFDTREPTFRDKIYPEYKANRKEPPEDLVPQFPYFEKIVNALNIKDIAVHGYEADDVIGTVAESAVKKGYEVVVVTGDKDFMQLVNDHISLFDTMKERRIDREAVMEKFGVEPKKVVDVMSLMGDSSDNIPGVKGVGGKSATNLIKQYGSIENVLANIEKVSNERIKTALKNHIDEAKISHKLVQIKKDVPLDYDWKEFEVCDPDYDKLKKLFSELEFFRLLREMLPESKKEKGKNLIKGQIVTKKDLKRVKDTVLKSTRSAFYFLYKEGSIFPFLGLGIAADHTFFYMPIQHDTLESVENVDIEVALDFVNEFRKENISLFDSKKVRRVLRERKIDLDKCRDVQLMSYVLDSASPKDLVTLAQQTLNIHLPENKKKKKNESVSMDEATLIACQNADFINELCTVFEERLKENESLREIYYEIELPLVDILVEMEERGVKVDVERLKKLAEEYDKKIKKLEKKIYKEAGEEFNVGSPKQLSKILFGKLEIPPVKKTKTGYSTDSSVLQQLAADFDLPALILDYRSVAKLKSTYIDVLPTLVSETTSRIHTTFNQAVTATGRLSSSDPNLQNVPARTEEGMKIREAFIADEGFVLLSADYSQIELRILAHISGEELLKQAFRKGEDVHAATAMKIFDVDLPSVDSVMRGTAKTVNFGVLYGQSAYGLSKQLDIPVEEADSYIKNYYRTYPKVKELKKEILAKATKNEYVETLFGRRRYVPDINSSNKSVKAFTERMAFNAVFQGTAADIIKKAMIEIASELSGYNANMLLQVHDELVFEVKDKELNEIKELIRDKMCNVYTLEIPLEIDIGIGDNWAKCK